jgi:hypothetical protein
VLQYLFNFCRSGFLNNDLLLFFVREDTTSVFNVSFSSQFSSFLGPIQTGPKFELFRDYFAVSVDVISLSIFLFYLFFVILLL